MQSPKEVSGKENKSRTKAVEMVKAVTQRGCGAGKGWQGWQGSVAAARGAVHSELLEQLLLLAWGSGCAWE